MKHVIMSLAAVVLLACFSVPAIAQDEKVKEKEIKEKKKDVEQFVITRKGNSDEKIVIEIKGDKVTINGKPSEELKDGNVTVRRNKFNTYEGFNAMTVPGFHGDNAFTWQGSQDGFRLDFDENTAMLGVVTEKVDEGVEINEVTKESAAAKAGLKSGDIITKFNDTKIEDPDDLSAAVRKQKPGQKVTISYLRDKKEQKATAELGKWKGAGIFNATPHIPDMQLFNETRPRVRAVPGTPYGQNWTWAAGGPRLGLSVQDTDDGKGVKVIEVDEESNAAKAGVKEGDILTHVNDKEVNGADEVAKVVKENKDKSSIKLQLKRDGKTQNIEVKIPKKLKSADL
jgi:serine protease Do